MHRLLPARRWAALAALLLACAGPALWPRTPAPAAPADASAFLFVSPNTRDDLDVVRPPRGGRGGLRALRPERRVAQQPHGAHDEGRHVADRDQVPVLAVLHELGQLPDFRDHRHRSGRHRLGDGDPLDGDDDPVFDGPRGGGGGYASGDPTGLTRFNPGVVTLPLGASGEPRDRQVQAMLVAGTVALVDVASPLPVFDTGFADSIDRRRVRGYLSSLAFAPDGSLLDW